MKYTITAEITFETISETKRIAEREVRYWINNRIGFESAGWGSDGSFSVTPKRGRVLHTKRHKRTA